LWPPWGNHKGYPYDVAPNHDSFTPSSALGYDLTPLPGLWNGHAKREDFVRELLTQHARRG